MVMCGDCGAHVATETGLKIHQARSIVCYHRRLGLDHPKYQTPVKKADGKEMDLDNWIPDKEDEE